MSYQDGWAALNLEMPDRVPRTEYSVDGYHFALMRRVTGIPVTAESPAQERLRAAQAFRKAWTFDFAWSTLIANQIYKGFCTNMGHASYAAAGSDYDNALYWPAAWTGRRSAKWPTATRAGCSNSCRRWPKRTCPA